MTNFNMRFVDKKNGFIKLIEMLKLSKLLKYLGIFFYKIQKIFK